MTMEAPSYQLAEAGQVELVIAFQENHRQHDEVYPSYCTVDGIKKEVLSTQFEGHLLSLPMCG